MKTSQFITSVLYFSAFGISRSATIVIAYLLTITKRDWKTCLEVVQTVRPIANPNVGFMRQLADYQVYLIRQSNYAKQCDVKMHRFWNYHSRQSDMEQFDMLLSGNYHS